MRIPFKLCVFSLCISFTAAAQMDTTTKMAIEDDKKTTEHPVASSEFDLMDKNKDGRVTEEEASDIGVNSLFSDMDINGDGVLSRKEYMKYRDQKTPQTREDF